MDVTRATITSTPTPYPDPTPQLEVIAHDIKQGIFESWNEVITDRWVSNPPLDQPLPPGHMRTIDHSRQLTDGFVKLTNGLRIPLHRGDLQESATHFEEIPAGHNITDANGKTQGEVELSELWLRDDPKLELYAGGNDHFCQTLKSDGTTEFTLYTGGGWEHWSIHPDGRAEAGDAESDYPNQPVEVKASVDPNGAVAFYENGTPARVIMPLLPLDQYMPPATTSGS